MKPLVSPLVVYHKNCLDGFGAAYAAWKKFGSHATYLPLDYSERDTIFQHQLIDRDIFVLDFSFTPEQTTRIITLCGQFTWLDHHRSAFEEWAKGEEYQLWIENTGDGVYILLDNSKSGAILAWEYFHSKEPIPSILYHIDDRDRWQWLIGGTKEVTTYLSTLEQDFLVWENVVVGYEESPQTLISYGALLDNYYQTQLQRAVAATKEQCEIGGIIGLCANLPPLFASEAGNLLAKESGTYGATWFKEHSGNIKWSLRSIGDFDVAAIAAKFGGGGHKNAAGFTLLAGTDSGTERGVKLWHTS